MSQQIFIYPFTGAVCLGQANNDRWIERPSYLLNSQSFRINHEGAGDRLQVPCLTDRTGIEQTWPLFKVHHCPMFLAESNNVVVNNMQPFQHCTVNINVIAQWLLRTAVCQQERTRVQFTSPNERQVRQPLPMFGVECLICMLDSEAHGCRSGRRKSPEQVIIVIARYSQSLPIHHIFNDFSWLAVVCDHITEA